MNKGKWIAKMIVFGLVAITVFGFIVMSLWNWLVPELFSGPTLSFWQALGLLALSKILFWSGGGKGGHWRSSNHGPWKANWRHRWERMSPEDRERFKQKMKDKWCGYTSRSESPEQGNANG